VVEVVAGMVVGLWVVVGAVGAVVASVVELLTTVVGTAVWPQDELMKAKSVNARRRCTNRP
jgi:hypothetical protein